MYEIDIKNKLEEITGKKNIKLTVPPGKVEGDLSTNAAMVSNISADTVSEELKKLNCIEDIKILGPGFINIKVSEEAIRNELEEIVKIGNKYGSGQVNDGVIFEMVSSNPTGPLHIGHGRGAAIGDSLSRIYNWFGYKVYKEYYVNDAGRQMNLLGQSVWNRINGKEVPDDGYKGSYIEDIALHLKGDCKSVEECSIKAGKLILDEHIRVLEKFGVEYNNVFSEKKLIEENKVNQIIESLKKKEFTYEKAGALWFKTTEYGDDTDRVLIKMGGDLTYFASDCAYHYNKAERFSHLMNFWGADHHGYIPRMKAFWKAMGFDSEKSMDILLYQLVDLKRGSEKISMSTRAGEFVTLEEVINEVGKDAARFFMLMRSADAPLEFDLELAKEESKKNPVYYVQYSHARICSVFRKAGKDPEALDISRICDLGQEEKKVIIQLAHFPGLIHKCVDLKAPHLVTEYLRDTATVFHKYYDNVRVMGSDKEESKLLLLKGVKRIISIGLDLIGVNAPEKM